jgi:hypothetical protein
LCYSSKAFVLTTGKNRLPPFFSKIPVECNEALDARFTDPCNKFVVSIKYENGSKSRRSPYLNGKANLDM